MRISALLLACFLGVGLSAQSAPIRILMGEVVGINPLLLFNEDQLPPVDLIFDRLVSMDAEGNFLPEILERWELSPDQRQATLVLRSGLTWQDGSPLDADDILYTWNLIRTPRMIDLSDNLGRWIPHMAKVDRLSLKVTSDQPMATLLAELYNFIPVPKHLYQMVGDPAKHRFTWAPVGSGPYKVLPGATGREVNLVRWEGYRGLHPGQAPAIQFKALPAAYVKAILAHQAEFFTYNSDWMSNYLLRKGAIGDGGFVAHNTVQDGFSALWMNCDPRHSVLADVRIRQALANLVPFEEYARQRTVRPIQVANSVWHPLSWAFDPSPKPLPKRDLALQLLDQAGYKLGSKGWRQNAQGRELIITLLLTTPLRQNPLVQRWVDSLIGAGVRVDAQVVSNPAIQKAQAEGRGDVWLGGWVNNGPDPSGDRLLYTSEGLPSHTNYTGYRNSEVDRLFEVGRHEVDLESRKAIYHRINQILFRDRPLILLEYSPAYAISTKALKGVVWSSRGVHYGFIPGIRGWHMEAGS